MAKHGQSSKVPTSDNTIKSPEDMCITFSIFDWNAKSSNRLRLLKLNWEHQKAKSGKDCYIQLAVRTWNKLQVGRQLFPIEWPDKYQEVRH